MEQESGEPERFEEAKAYEKQLRQIDSDYIDELKKAEVKRKERIAVIIPARNRALEDVENFWGDSLVNHPHLGMLIDEDDIEVFGYLRKFTITEKPSTLTTKLVTFTFGPNPYFKNAILVKSYSYEGQKLSSKKHEKVEWKGGKGLDTDQDQSTFFSWYEDDTLMDQEVMERLELDFYLYPTKFYEDEPDASGAENESDNEAGLYSIEE